MTNAMPVCKIESINEDFDLDALEEKAADKDDGVKSIGKRSFVCKTLTTVKSRSTFVETSTHKGSFQAHFNFSSVAIGTDTLTKPSSHKGSSDLFVGLNYPLLHPESKTSKDQ